MYGMVNYMNCVSPRGHRLRLAFRELAPGAEVLGERASRHVLVDQVPEALLG